MIQETDKQPPSEIETIKSEISQLEHQINEAKRQAAYHLLERDLHNEHYQVHRQQMNELQVQYSMKQVELQKLSNK